MPTRRPPHGVLVGLALAATAAAIAFVALSRPAVVLDPPPPRIVAEALDTLPALPVSVVEAPVTYDLDEIVDSLEAAVPKTYGDLETRIETAQNKRVKFAYLLHRSPFRVSVRGQTVRVSADIEYSGRLWYDPTLGPEVELACGTGNDRPRRATLTIATAARLTPNWDVRTHTRVVRLAALSDSGCDRCRLTFLRIDVTDRILEHTRRKLDDKLVLFDRTVERWPVRRRFEKIWFALQKPVRLADSVYFAIHPTRAYVGSIGAEGRTAFANLRLLAAPRVSTGPRPQLAPVPLPPLERADVEGRGARVLMDAMFTYPVATSLLRKALVGRSLEQAGHLVRIRDVRLSGIGGGRVALGVRLSGAVSGRVFFSGTPQFDPETREITVPDLDYDVGTAEALVRGYAWLRGVEIREFLRASARLPDSVVMDPLTRLAEEQINRDLPARGTHLGAAIGRTGMIAVRATLKGLQVRALADADLTLSIRRAPSIPRPPAPAAQAATGPSPRASRRPASRASRIPPARSRAAGPRRNAGFSPPPHVSMPGPCSGTAFRRSIGGTSAISGASGSSSPRAVSC